MCRVRVRWLRSRQRGCGRLPPGETVCTKDGGWTMANTFATDCGGGRHRARNRGFEGAEPPATLLQAPLRARAARRSKSIMWPGTLCCEMARRAPIDG